MKNKRMLSAVFSLMILLCAGCSGCKYTQDCGTWVFNGGPSGNSYPMNAAFTFNPANCGKDCSVQTDCIIQMVSVFNLEDHTYMFASDQSGASARATDYGWTIDQIDGWAFAYYSLNNDGTFDNGYNPPGSNGVATTLFDAPGGWPANTLFYALDAAVAYSSKTCQNRILGYYFWSWASDNAGQVSTFINGPAWKDLDLTFQKAVAGWNAWAPGSPSQNEGPGQPILPHAVPLPALTDL